MHTVKDGPVGPIACRPLGPPVRPQSYNLAAIDADARADRRREHYGDARGLRRLRQRPSRPARSLPFARTDVAPCPIPETRVGHLEFGNGRRVYGYTVLCCRVAKKAIIEAVGGGGWWWKNNTKCNRIDT